MNRFLFIPVFLFLMASGCLSDPQPQPDPGMNDATNGGKGGDAGASIPSGEYNGAGDVALIKVSAPDPDSSDTAVAGLKGWIDISKAGVVQVVNRRTKESIAVDCDQNGEFGELIPAMSGDSIEIWISRAQDQGSGWSIAATVTVPSDGWASLDGGVPDVLSQVTVSPPSANGVASISVEHASITNGVSGVAANLDAASTDNKPGSNGVIQLSLKAKAGDRAVVFLVDSASGKASQPLVLQVPTN